MLYDKRKLKRYDIFLIVEFKPLNKAGRYAIGITRNLSSEGFSMESQGFDFECGEILEFRLKHPGNDISVTLAGDIVWKKQSWYKHIIGVKLVEVSEESKSKILSLMSTVKEVTDESALISEEIERVPEWEKEEKPAVEPVTRKSDDLIPDIAKTKSSNIALNEKEDSEPSGTKSTVVALGELGISSEKVVEAITLVEDMVSTEKEDEQISDDYVADKELNPEAVQVTPVNAAVEELPEQTHGVQDEKEREISTAQNTIHDIDAAIVKDRKRMSWLYIPVAIFALIIFAIALPKVLDNYKDSYQSKNRIIEEPASYQDIDKEGALSADNGQTDSQSLQESYEPLQFQSTRGKNSTLQEQEEAVDLGQLSAPPLKPDLKSRELSGTVPRVEMGNILKYESVVSKSDIPVPTQLTNQGKLLKTELIAKQDNPPKTDSVQKGEQTKNTEREINIKHIDKSELASKIRETQQTMTVDMTKRKPESLPAENNKRDNISETSATATIMNHQKNKAFAEAEMAAKAEPADKRDKNNEIAIIVQPEKTSVNVLIEKPQETEMKVRGEGNREGELVVKTGEKSETELIAKIEKPGKNEPVTVKNITQKADPVDKISKLPKIALLVAPNKLKESQNISGKNTDNDLIKRWQHIGVTKDGIPLFIDSGNMSYPSEHIVKLMMRASINKRDFIDLLEINCLQTKLRIIEERTGNNPVLSVYSSEWRDIIPESMLLYNAACSKQK